MDFRIEARAYDDPDVVRLVAAVQAEYVIRYGGPDAAVVNPAELHYAGTPGAIFYGKNLNAGAKRPALALCGDGPFDTG